MIVALLALSACGEETLTISGTVTYSDGTPCGGCPVGVSSSDHTIGEYAVVTQEDGTYTWTVPGSGDFTLVSGGGSTDVHLERGTDAVDADIVLPEAAPPG